MKRREFIGTLAGGAVAAALPTRLLGAEKVYVIGWLGAGIETVNRQTFIPILLNKLQELGYSEGKNLRMEYRFAEGHLERLPELAAELVRLPRGKQKLAGHAQSA
jgi:putative ABC transport system substrate-binding protein